MRCSASAAASQAGTHLLDERLAQNLLGAACMIAPAFFLLPVRTESVVRRYARLTLAAVGLCSQDRSVALVAKVRAAVSHARALAVA